MAPDDFIRNALEPALRLLPPKMDSPAARAMIVAICLQESRLKHRFQIGGPARGYPQFEKGTKETRGGITGILMHPASQPFVLSVLKAMDYPEIVEDIELGKITFAADACYVAIEHSDILAAAFSRSLLWTLPSPLPGQGSPDIGWAQYMQTWRPGQPHKETWNSFYTQAWSLI